VSVANAGHAVNERSLRIPTIAADLLPAEIVESRRTRKVRRLVLAFVAGVTVLLGVWYAGTVQQTTTVERERDRAQETVTDLTRLQRDFNEVVNTQAEADSVNKQLTALMAGDLQWSRLLTSLHAVAPSGITLTGVIAALDGPDSTGANTDPTLTGTTDRAIGSLTVNGTGSSKPVIAAYVDALAKVSGVRNALLGEVTQQDKGLDFSVRLDITRSALGGRFAAASPSASGK
jgi:Tfp pilus assembly protein PilN